MHACVYDEARCGSGCGAMGVADGVGGWHEDGVNAAEYARCLMMRCAEAVDSTAGGEAPRWARVLLGVCGKLPGSCPSIVAFTAQGHLASPHPRLVSHRDVLAYAQSFTQPPGSCLTVAAFAAQGHLASPHRYPISPALSCNTQGRPCVCTVVHAAAWQLHSVHCHPETKWGAGGCKRGRQRTARAAQWEGCVRNRGGWL